MHTALAGAVAARHLAPAGATAVGIIGAGVQAKLQLEALRLVRPIDPGAGVGTTARRRAQAGADRLGAARGADRFVCDSRSRSASLGELRSLADEDPASELDTVELGELITGQRAGRSRDDDITICDLTGTGAQDTALASLAVDRARAAGLGTVVEH